MKRDEFRRLVEGEVVLPTDECLHESGEWRPAQGYIGKPAPDPKYTAHCQFRRRETEGAELRPDPKAEIPTRLDEHLSEAGHEFQPMYCAFCYSYQQTFWKISQNPATASINQPISRPTTSKPSLNVSKVAKSLEASK